MFNYWKNEVKNIKNKNMANSYAKQYASVDMIKEIAKKMYECYLTIIENQINKMDMNECQFSITYTLSRSGVLFVKEECSAVDVKYKEWGYEAIEDEVKRLGVAMALRDIVVPAIEKCSVVKSINADISERYGWVDVTMNIKVSQGNKLKTL